MKYIFLSLFVLVSLSFSKDTSHRIAEIPEASGISYCKNSDTLVVANDEGRYYEIDREGNILNKKRVGKHDLEGVVCTNKKFIFAIEDEGLLFVDRKNGKKKKVTFDTAYRNKKLPLFDKKNGAEGIAKDGNTFYLAKQAKKKQDSFIAVVHHDRYHSKIIDLVKHKIPDTAGLTFHNGYLYMVSDKKDLLIQYDLKKKKITYRVKLPKAAHEGIAFDGKGFVYIADDDGYVLKFSEKDLGL
ncbi:MAG: SdiA-regulated domain-containing protein [Campylobacterota bacterium]|nr:SdiA-regulated domain-containing protein [Campylobacterota bacterium]